MTAMELLYNFNVELNQIYEIPSLESDEAFYWINKAQEKFVNDKYVGNIGGTKKAFEENQRKIDELRTLVKPYSNVTTSNTIPLPNDYRHLLRITIYHSGACINNPDLVVTRNDTLTTGGKVYLPVVPMYCQQDDINFMLQDPFSAPDETMPLFVIENNIAGVSSIRIYLPANVTMVGYRMTYLSNPAELTTNDLNTQKFTGKTYTNTTQLPDFCYIEIMNNAIKMYVKSLKMLTNQSELETNEPE